MDTMSQSRNFFELKEVFVWSLPVFFFFRKQAFEKTRKNDKIIFLYL